MLPACPPSPPRLWWRSRLCRRQRVEGDPIQCGDGRGRVGRLVAGVRPVKIVRLEPV